MSDLLIDVQINKLLNNNNISENIISLIDNIQIKFENIFYKLKDGYENNNSKREINYKYLIPFKIIDSKIIFIKKKELKIRSYEDLINHNNNLLYFVIDNTFNIKDVDYNTAKKNIEKKYYKDILAYYLFNVINIIYDICEYYIKYIDSQLLNISITNKKKFGNLNLENAFKHTSLLKRSLNKFKLILLNNFYSIFLPNKITKGLYGMIKNENGYYVKENNCNFIGSAELILKKYPFQYFRTNILLEDIDSINNLIDFCININNTHDIYDKDDKLFFGGYSFNYDISKSSINILNDYFNNLNEKNLCNIFIIEKIIDFFKIKNSIPFELIDNYEDIKNNLMIYSNNNPFSKDLKIQILNKYENIIKKVTKYLIENYKIKNKIKLFEQRNNDDNNIQNLYIMEELYELYYKVYYLISCFILKLVQKKTKDISLKNDLLQKFFKIKSNYEFEFQSYMNKF